MSAALQSTSEGASLILTLSNPAHMNALEPDIYAAGIEALGAAEKNPEVRSVVITGEGAMFCAGINLQQLQACRHETPEVQAQAMQGLNNWLDAIHTYPKPVIAAVEGLAGGAGFSLALACDFIVAAESAVFVMPSSTVALSPDGGGSWHLARSLPRALVSELLMTAERISAQRLHSLGLINRVSRPGQALHDALALAARLNERAPNALTSIKALINDASANTLSQQMDSEALHFVRNLHHANAGEGIEALLQKRTPQYR